MTTRKAVFSDVDKTLRTPGIPMEETVKDLIRNIISLGVLFVYCTGKPCSYMTGAATEWQTNNAYILGSTGSVLYKGTTMPPEHGCEIYPFNRGEVSQFRNFMAEMHKKLYGVKGIFWQPNGEASDFVSTPFWGNDTNLRQKVMDAFYDVKLYMPHDKIKGFDNIDALDIMIASVDKARGMRWVAEMEGISEDQCYALGDSDNDLPMLLEAKKYGHDYVVGDHCFEGGYEPTHRFQTYQEMLQGLLKELH